MKAREISSNSPRSSRKLTKVEVAELLGVSCRTVENYMRSRRLPFLKIGRSVRFDLARVEEALARYEVKEVA